MNFNRDAISKIIVIVLAGAVLFWLVTSYNKQKEIVEKETFEPDNSELLAKTSPEIEASEAETNETPKPVDYETNQYASDCFPKDKLTAQDLLPKNASDSTWSQVSPAGQGDVDTSNYLNAGYLQGINTIGSTLRNANLDIRSSPIISKQNVSPWLNSTIEPDLNRRPLEIGMNCEC
jgi:hypothetical protein